MSTNDLPSRTYPVEPISKMARRTALVFGAFAMLIALSFLIHSLISFFFFLDGK